MLPFKKEIERKLNNRLLGSIDVGCTSDFEKEEHLAKPIDHQHVASFVQNIADQSCEKQLVGVAISVIIDGKESSAVAGLANSDSQTPVSPSTIFEIGSLSKVFTSLLLAVSASKQEIDLDAPVQSALDNVRLPTDRDGKPITWRSLANHRSSLPRLPDDLLRTADIENPYAHYDDEMLYASLSQMKPLRPIGSQSEYSNFGVGLLGHALGKVAGSDFHQSLKQRVLVPLQLGDTATETGGEAPDQLATAYQKQGKPVKHWDFSECTAAAGGVRSSLRDMTRFLRACIFPGETKLADEIELMQEPSNLPNGRPNSAWKLRKIPGGVIMFLLVLVGLTILEVFKQWPLNYWRWPLCLIGVFGCRAWGVKWAAIAMFFLPLALRYFFGVNFKWADLLLIGLPSLYVGWVWQWMGDSRDSGHLAWQSSKVAGHEMLWHNGMVGGAASFLGFVPKLEVGVVVLTNTQTHVDASGIEILSELIRLEEERRADS